MTNKLRLVLACGDYDRTRALSTGEIRPEGLELNYLSLDAPEEVFWRMTIHREFDAAEMCLGTYLHQVSMNDCPFVGIPVFPSRAFRHSAIYVHREAGIEGPEDLVGKRVGIPEWQIAAVVWVRGILAEDYGVDMRQIQWLQGGLETMGRIPKVSITPPPNVYLEPIPPDKTLRDMFHTRDVDAIISPRKPTDSDPESSVVTRLFSNYRDVEVEYFQRTSIFPIMHLVVIRKEIYESNPWVAQTLFKAFEEAKQRCVAAFAEVGALRYMLPWLAWNWEETCEVMGSDYWPYGIDANRVTIERFLDYAHESGVTSRRVSIEEAFVESTLTGYRT